MGEITDPAVPERTYTASVKSTTTPEDHVEDLGHPREQFEIELTPIANDNAEDTEVYPTGPRFAAVMVALCFSLVLVGLDLTILATAIPSITNHFKTIADIGWYSSALRLTSCSFQFMFGKIYTMFSVKRIFLISLVIFETGALLSAVAPTSKALVIARAVSGFGCAGIIAGVRSIRGDMINAFTESHG